MNNYKTLTWKHIGGQMPQLRLFPEGGGEEEVVAIAAWSTDEINAFLKQVRRRCEPERARAHDPPFSSRSSHTSRTDRGRTRQRLVEMQLKDEL